MPRLSAIICTHNRLRYLEGSIGSLARQTLDPAEFEIILVDNASTDGTRAFVEEKQRSVPNLRYLLETNLGLSHARNAGWRSARGEIVAYLDDDAVAAPNWGEKVLEKFAQHDAKLAAIGGKIDPLWEATPPDWLGPRMWGFLTIIDWSPTEMVLNDPYFFGGANMAMRKSALAEVGGFSGVLGRKGKSLLSNEELHLKHLLEAKGYYALYTPDVLAQHSVPRERMTKEWFRSRYYWQGVSNAYMEDAMNKTPGAQGSWLRAVARNARASWRLWRARGKHLPEAAALGPDLQDFLWQEKWGYIVARWKLLFGRAG